MRIVIDGRMLGWTGIGRYTRHVIDEVARQSPDDELVVLVRPQDRSTWSPPAANVSSHPVDLRPYSLAEQRHLAAAVGRLRPELVHFPHFTAPVRPVGPSVVTIHDLTMRRFRNVAGEGRREHLRYGVKHRAMGVVLPLVARRARRVLVPTEFVAGEVVDLLGVDRGRVVVTPEAAEPLTADPEPVAGLGDGRPFLLHVGNFYPHKNLALLLEAFGRLGGGGWPGRLVLAGPPDWFAEQLRRSAERAGRSDRVVFTGRVSDGQLAWLYRRAELFVLPSRSEGFGLVGLEAMAGGLPVVAARCSCLPEVYGEAAEYFDPDDPVGLADRLASLLADGERRALLAGRGRDRAAIYSWAATGRLTLAAYRQAVG